MLAKSAPQVYFNLLEVQRSKARSGTSIDPWLISDDLTPQRFREATKGLPKIALEEVDDRRGEVQLPRTFEDIGLGQRILCHPLSEVSDHLGRRRNFDDIAALAEQVSFKRIPRRKVLATSSLASIYFFLTSVETITILFIRRFSALTCPLSAQTKLGCLKLLRSQSKKKAEGYLRVNTPSDSCIDLQASRGRTR
jgi:hypothetical protein